MGRVECGQYDKWVEYDQCAEWCARNGYTGKRGDPLPSNTGDPCIELINADIDAFMQRVAGAAYALHMGKLNLPEDMD